MRFLADDESVVIGAGDVEENEAALGVGGGGGIIIVIVAEDESAVLGAGDVECHVVFEFGGGGGGASMTVDIKSRAGEENGGDQSVHRIESTAVRKWVNLHLAMGGEEAVVFPSFLPRGAGDGMLADGGSCKTCPSGSSVTQCG